MSLNQFDVWIQHFIHKCVQVIVQSRLGNEKTQTKCNPNGKDMFSLNIDDIKDISEQTNKCLRHASGQTQPQSLYFIKKEWKICCEISMKNSDGITIVLEYWILSNQPSFNEYKGQDKLSQIIGSISIRMSNLLKSLIVLTRSTPAHRLSSKGQSADSYVICYRVYQINENLNSFMQSSEHSSHYSTAKTIGVIKSDFNELSMLLIYRTDMNINSESEIKNLAKINEKTNNNNNNSNNETDDLMLSLKDDHFKKDVSDTFDMFDIIKPLNPAFASKKNDVSDSDLNTPFSSLLPLKEENDVSKNLINNNNNNNQNNNNNGNEKKSNPISIPISNIASKTPSKSPQIYSTSNDSFVFVDLQAPFVADDTILNSFFHGPSPTFVNSKEDVNNDITQLGLQLSEFELEAPQIDSFVESVCENEDLRIET